MGILGGTFNPPHLGHLALARGARDELGLARVQLIPASTPPHKRGEHDPGAQHRVQMCRLLVDGERDVSVCTLEIERTGPSYTVDTLRALHASHPETEFTLVTGADSARTMPRWREATTLFEHADVAVAARAGTDRRAVADALAPLLGGAQLRFLLTPMPEVSSSEVRERAARGEDVAELVGSGVAAYMREHALYRTRELAS